MEKHPAATKSLVLAVFLSLFMAGLVSAQLPPPMVEFIPDQISAGSGFVMVADPGSVTEPVRITWNTGPSGYGLFPLVDGEHVCYFSDTDPASLCGPSPFRVASPTGYPYRIDFSTSDKSGNQGNSTLYIDVGGIGILPGVSMSGNNAIMLVYLTGPADSVQYRVYDSSFVAVTEYKQLSFIPGGGYNGSTPLGTGKYYIAFKADSATDFGGGIVMVDNGGTITNGENTTGILEVDGFDVTNIFIDKGETPELSIYNPITNTMNQNYTGITIELPTTTPLNIRSYLRVTPSATELDPFGTIYYNVSFIRSIDSDMDINTEAEIKSAGVTLGTIPIRVKVSVRGSTVTNECSAATDMTPCTGGLCCLGVCRTGAECCDDTDCATGEECSTGYQCVTAPVYCSVGTCRTSCYAGEESTSETCTISGLSGVCCVEVNECSGQSDGAPCTSCTESTCVCCDEYCSECCEDSHCSPGYECIGNYCYESDTPEPGFDMMTIILIVVVVAAGGFAAYYFLKMRKKPPGSKDDEFEGDKIDEDETFDDEEFY